MEHIGTGASGYTDALAKAINDSGTAVGIATKYDGGGPLGRRAVRWDASGTAATELGHLGTTTLGYTDAMPYAINSVGTTVGYAAKYNSGPKGNRAVRWNASGTAAIELGHLGTGPTGYANTGARAINDAGTIVGYAHRYDSEGYRVGRYAVLWGADGLAVDLNMLIDPVIPPDAYAICAACHEQCHNKGCRGCGEDSDFRIVVACRFGKWDLREPADVAAVD